jgi:hypothetical protein
MPGRERLSASISLATIVTSKAMEGSALILCQPFFIASRTTRFYASSDWRSATC